MTVSLFVPTVCTQLLLRKSHRFHHIVKAVETQGCEIKLLLYLIKHFLIIRAVGIRIIFQDLIRYILALSFPDDPARYKIIFRIRTGKIKEPASMKERRSRRSYMNLPGSAVIKELGSLTELGSSYDRIVNKKQ